MIDVPGLNEANNHYPDKQRFKYKLKCIIWSPLSCVTWFIPCIGHVAIGDSEGNTYDFHGTNLIGKNNLLFGYPTKVLQMAEPGVDDEEWDKTLKESILKYQHQEYNILTNNCHDFAACTLNALALPDYKDVKFDTNSIMMLMFTKGHFLSKQAIGKTWLPFALLVALIVLLCIVFYCVYSKQHEKHMLPKLQ